MIGTDDLSILYSLSISILCSHCMIEECIGTIIIIPAIISVIDASTIPSIFIVVSSPNKPSLSCACATTDRDPVTSCNISKKIKTKREMSFYSFKPFYNAR